MSASRLPDPPARPERIAVWFRRLAVAEAFSWGALLVAMFFKYVVQADPEAGIEGGVPVAGAVHGGLFVAYCVAAVVAWWAFSWRLPTLVLALFSAVPPFMTVWFERRALRRGQLRPARHDTGSATRDAAASTDR